MTSSLQISVVIPTYNRAASLRAALESLNRQFLDSTLYEIIVIDDGSTDNTAEVVASFPNIRYIVQKNQGPATARNCGAELAKAPLILFFDDDVVAAPDLLQKHLEAHEQYDPCSVLGYTPFADDLPDTPIMEYHAARWARIFYEAQIYQQNMKQLPYRLFITINLSVRKADFEAVGPFYTGLSGAAFEDTQLGSRFERANIPLLFYRAAQALHRPSITTTSITERRRHFGYLAGLYFAEWPDDDHLRESMQVDYVLGHIPSGTKPLRRGKIIVRDRFVMSRPIAVLCLILGQQRRLPAGFRFYCLNLVSLYWYRRGFRQALWNA